ncbi:pyridoxamine 5'-phosphate oxidase family protein [Fontivita pretiosa]|jgi:PPOX class probable FMN-dependent enzyme|uniref:pyridoxamine 5'-phosphate oxidase family protein n=1 Tax=Fontivita pretiosa TaxID=2989684 RepID=UPI003D179755
MQWLDELGNSVRREFGDSPKLMVLATVDRSGAPHARMVVCRRIDEEGRLYVATDARTEKAAQLRGERRVEAVFWLPSQQTQFRISGEAKIVAFAEDETLRRQLWRELNDQARAMFFWPTPGIARSTDDVFAQAVSADVPPPQAFEVLIIEPRQVDRLSLDSHPHRRRVWRADAKWAPVDVNP